MAAKQMLNGKGIPLQLDMLETQIYNEHQKLRWNALFAYHKDKERYLCYIFL